MKILRISIVMLLVALTACGTGSLTKPDELVRYLQARHIAVTMLGNVYAPLTLRGERLLLGGTGIPPGTELAVYTDPRKMIEVGSGGATIHTPAQESTQVIGRGTPTDANQPRVLRRPWEGGLHLFRSQDLLVVYLGNDALVIALLTQALGAAVANL